VARPSFDSRLLGLVAEPGGFAKSIADAVNYQFGFQVSSTWFYQLLQRWLFPIVVLAGVVVMALTGVVIVDAEEQAVLQRWGRRVGGAVLSPGVHFKWPYPIDIVYRAPVKRVSEVVLGESEGEEHGEKDGAVIWTEQHEYVPEMMLLVAAQRPESSPIGAEAARRDGGSVNSEESVPVGLLMVSVPIEYRIRDIGKYLSVCEDSKKLLESVAYQQFSEYAASVNLDQLIGPGRERFNAEFRAVLQKRLDELDFGIEVAFVGLNDVHPPAKDNVAAAFQEVVSAETRMSATLRAAEGVARRTLITLAGTEARAVILDDAIRERDRHPTGSSGYGEADQRVKDLLLGNPEKSIPPCSGAAAAQIAQARVAASSRIGEAASKALTFGAQLAAYRAAPALYPVRKFLEVFGELDTARKFLIVGDPSNITIEYETAKEAGLDQVLGEGLDRERKKRPPGQP
jgi:regulator of protease activity HflC (stomatin/prohibitin superfamily)